MKMMSVEAFKRRCLRVIEQVRRSHVSVLIMEKGVPLVKLVPAGGRAADVFGCMTGTAEIKGDLAGPVVAARAWTGAR